MASILSLLTKLPSDCCLCEQPVNPDKLAKPVEPVNTSHQSMPISEHNTPPIICADCHQQLPFLNHCCPICAMPLPAGESTQQVSSCGACLKQAPFFKRCVAAFHYEPPISQFISQLKFNAQFQYQNLLCYYLIAAVRQQYQHCPWPQALIAVPLHSKKTKQRGFNQSLLLAKTLSSQLSIKLLTNAVKRTRYTQAQTKLNAKQRHKNLKGAFNVDIEGKLDDNLNSNHNSKPNTNQYQHIALIDDVMTTGTTANEIAEQLIKKGVEQVDVWCVARAFAI